MKILVICQYYYPEPFRITDICEGLAKNGHDVTVVTGIPNYPEGVIYPGYEKGGNRDEIRNGVKIHRCFTIGRKGGILKRFLNYYSYVISSTAYIRSLPGDFDVVFVNQLSPVMMAEAAIRYKKRHGKKMVLYSLDLWPESLLAGGIRKGSLIYRIFHGISKRIYRKADLILTSSRQFDRYFVSEFGCRQDQIKYLPQYAESLFDPVNCRKKEDGFIDLMFAGNIGKAQRVDVILQAAAKTADIPNLRWHIVGDGSELENCKKLTKELQLTSVIFHGRQKTSEMARFYAMADAMLVSVQKDPVISMTLPGKVQTCMAAGKPMIATADGETAVIINEAKCGLCGAAESAEELAENVKRFMSLDRKELGKNARSYYETHFDRTKCLEKLQNFLDVRTMTCQR